FTWDAGHPIMSTPNIINGIATNSTIGFGTNGQRMEPAAGASTAGFVVAPTPNEAAIIVGSSGNTIAHGFMADNWDPIAFTDLVENEAEFLLFIGDPPVIACPADVVANNDPGTCGAIVNFAGVAFDTEDGNISGDIIATPPSGSVFPVGSTTV